MQETNYISLRDSIQYYPAPPSLSTVVRWATLGVNGCQLKTAKFAGKRLTRVAWVAEFVKLTFEASPDSYKSEGQAAAHEIAESRLQKMVVQDV